MYNKKQGGIMSKYLDLKVSYRKEQLLEAANYIKEGKLVLFPTETVYVIGANGLDEKAVKSIFTAKGRKQDNPLILHVSSITMVEEISKNIFTLLRKEDAYNVDLVIIEGVEPTGLGLAIMNRLIRSCSHNYQEL